MRSTGHESCTVHRRSRGSVAVHGRTADRAWEAATWLLVGRSSTTARPRRPGQAVAPDERLSWGRTVGLGAQHVVAMFGATFVFPLIMGLNPQLAIMMSGIATIASC